MRTLLVTGASGYLGRLIAAQLLHSDDCQLLLPVRGQHSVETVVAPILEELRVLGDFDANKASARLHLLAWDADQSLSERLQSLAEYDVAEIIHCAGCVHYFDREKLLEGNQRLTEDWLNIGRDLSIDRFTFLSTAFSCGYRSGAAPETLHGEPASDPTDYTWSKRQSEHLVAESGLNWLILRPEIVIGHSQCGRYTGQNYGLYQLWRAAERFLCREYLPEVSVVAPRTPIRVIHQDAFQQAFLAAYRHAEPNAVVHLTAPADASPTLRELWELWFQEVGRPRKVHYYSRPEDIPPDALDRKQRTWMEFVAVNLDIAASDWCFERTSLDRWEQAGLMPICPMTLETVLQCQRRMVRDSSRIQSFLERTRDVRPGQIQAFEMPRVHGSGKALKEATAHQPRRSAVS